MPNFFLNDKNYRPMGSAGIFFLTPAISMGLFSGLTPYALVNLIIFFIFLCAFCSSKDQVVSAGLFFILSSFITKILLLNDFFYLFFANPKVIILYKGSYRVLSAIFILIGFFIFLDWIKLKINKKDNKLFIKYPVFFKNIDGVFGENELSCYNGLLLKRSFIFILLLSVFLGVLFTVLESLWPQDYIFFVESYFFRMQGKNLVVKLRLFIYSWFFIAPMLFLWLGTLKVFDCKGALAWISRHASIVKIIFSALFMAIGLSIIYIV